MEQNRIDVIAKDNKMITVNFYYEGEMKLTYEFDLKKQKDQTDYRFTYSDLVGRGAKLANMYRIENGKPVLVKTINF